MSTKKKTSARRVRPAKKPSFLDECAQSDFDHCHKLLDGAGVGAGETLAERILWVVNEWRRICNHPESCACQQCTASRKMLSAESDYQARAELKRELLREARR